MHQSSGQEAGTELKLQERRGKDPPYSAESKTTLCDEGSFALTVSLLFRGALFACRGREKRIRRGSVEKLGWGFGRRIFAGWRGRPGHQRDGSTHCECMRAGRTWYMVSFQSLTRVSMPPRAPNISTWITMSGSVTPKKPGLDDVCEYPKQEGGGESRRQSARTWQMRF